MMTVEFLNDIFNQYGGIMQTSQLEKFGISYRKIQKLIENGYIEKIRTGYYQWQDDRAFSDINAIVTLFPEAILCDDTALMYYGYTDRTAVKWQTYGSILLTLEPYRYIQSQV